MLGRKITYDAVFFVVDEQVRLRVKVVVRNAEVTLIFAWARCSSRGAAVQLVD